jgi:flagellar assembly factor FliW
MRVSCTKYFGTVDYRDESVICFPHGLPGFAEETQFLLIDQPVNEPLVFLQSLSRPDLCFLALPVLAVYPGYQLSTPAEDLATLGLPEDRQPEIGAELSCLAIVSLAEDRPPTANLLAPVVIHWNNRKAVQAIQAESGYSHEHPLFAEAEPCS